MNKQRLLFVIATATLFFGGSGDASAYRCRVATDAESIQDNDVLRERVDVTFDSETPYLGAEKPISNLRGTLTFSRPQQEDVSVSLAGGDGARGNGVIRLSFSAGRFLIFYDERERKVFVYKHLDRTYKVLNATAVCEEPGGRFVKYVLENHSIDAMPLSVRMQACYAGPGFCTETNETVSPGGLVSNVFASRVADVVSVYVFWPTTGQYELCLRKQLFPLMRGGASGYLLTIRSEGENESPVYNCRLSSY